LDAAAICAEQLLWFENKATLNGHQLLAFLVVHG